MYPIVTAFIRRLLRQPAVYFSLALIAGVWATAFQQSTTERDAITRDAANNTANFARVFEQDIIRAIGEADQTLKYVRRTRARGGPGTNWAAIVNESYTVSDQRLQLAVIDANGILIASNQGPQPPKPENLSDREYFRVHKNSAGDVLFISQPVTGRASGQASVQLTRRITAAGGAFGGVLVASLDPARFANSYSSAGLGQDSGLAVAGMDGIIRAGAGIFAARLGKSIKNEPIFKAFLGSTGDAKIEAQTVPGMRQSLAIRAVHGYPLLVLVARGNMAANALWLKNRIRYITGAAFLSLLIAFAAARVLYSGDRYETARLALARSEASEKLRARELELTLSHMGQGIIMVDENGKIAVINPRYAEMIGLPEHLQHPGASYDKLVEYLDSSGEFRDGSAKIDHPALEYIKASLQDALMPIFERVRPNGTVLEVRTEAIPGGGFVRTMTDITDRRRHEAKIFHMSRHDPLTDLGNRALLYENLDRALDSLDDGRQLAFHAIDLDRFKPVNDTFGHPMGDKLLKVVSERLCMNLRQGDVVARIGGDEFAVIEMSNVSRSKSEDIARRLCEVLSRPYDIDGQRLEISASIGIALAPQDGCDAAGLLKAADLALYTAKAGGRATYRFYNPEIESFAKARRELETGLRDALASNQLDLYYHPINCIASSRVTGYEALIRWHEPRRGLIQPAEFVSVAEEAGLIIPIGAWVLERACIDMAGQPEPLRVSVNLSPVQFRDPELVTIVKAALKKSGLAPQRLEIEITEATLMQSDALIDQQIRELRALGTGIAMDNFGTGYSSLRYLQAHPVDRIKIDRSFISRLGEDKCSETLIKAITSLSSALGMQTVAEGVETAEQLEKLAESGCTEAQGFYFSKPKPGREIFRTGYNGVPPDPAKRAG